MTTEIAGALRRIAQAAADWASLEHLTPAKRAMARVLAGHAAKLAAVRIVADADLAKIKLLTCTLYEEVTGEHSWSVCPFGLCRVAREGTKPPAARTGEADRGGSTGATCCCADGAASIESDSAA
jgi:hypothetical protein